MNDFDIRVPVWATLRTSKALEEHGTPTVLGNDGKRARLVLETTLPRERVEEVIRSALGPSERNDVTIRVGHWRVLVAGRACLATSNGQEARRQAAQLARPAVQVKILNPAGREVR